MDAAYRIRRAVAEDVERVFAMDREIENVPHWAMAEYLGALTPEDGKTRGDGTRRCLFVAWDGDAIAGFAVGRVTAIEAEVVAELESVGVAGSARCRGIGRELCEAVIGWARRQAATGIELEVRSKSEEAIALYRGLGFSATGMRKRYYRSPADDAVLMRLELGARAEVQASADSLRE